MATWRLGDLANLVAGDHGVPTRAFFSGVYLGLSSAFRKNVERFASSAPDDHAKPSLPRATIQASPPVPPLRIVKPHLSSLKQRRTYKIKLIKNQITMKQNNFKKRSENYLKDAFSVRFSRAAVFALAILFQCCFITICTANNYAAAGLVLAGATLMVHRYFQWVSSTVG